MLPYTVYLYRLTVVRRTDLIKQLKRIAKANNVSFDLAEGGSHTKVWINGQMITIPRHNEINEFTARGILSDATAAAKEE